MSLFAGTGALVQRHRRKNPWEGAGVGATVYLTGFGLLGLQQWASEDESIYRQTSESASGVGQLVFCPTADEGLKWKKAFVENAASSIRVCGNYGGGKTFQELLDKVEIALNKNDQATAHILMTPDLITKADRQRIKELEGKFPGRFSYLDLQPQTRVWPTFQISEVHQKMVIVDSNYWVVGGTGLIDYLSNKGDGTDPADPKNGTLIRQITGLTGSRDCDLAGKSAEMGGSLAHNFDRLWLQAGGVLAAEPAGVANIELGEESEAGEVSLHLGGLWRAAPTTEHPAWKQRILRLIGQADEIWIGNMAFNDPEITAALKGKKNLTVITNGDRKGGAFGARLVGKGNRLHYAKLENEAKVYEYEVDGVIYHKKAFVFRCGDEWHTLIGSANLNPRSTRCDHELLVEVKGKPMADKVVKSLEADIDHSVEITPSARPHYRTITGKVINYLVSDIIN